MRNSKIIILPVAEEPSNIETLEAKLSAFQIINFKGRARKRAQALLKTGEDSKLFWIVAQGYYNKFVEAAHA